MQVRSRICKNTYNCIVEHRTLAMLLNCAQKLPNVTSEICIKKNKKKLVMLKSQYRCDSKNRTTPSGKSHGSETEKLQNCASKLANITYPYKNREKSWSVAAPVCWSCLLVLLFFLLADLVPARCLLLANLVPALCPVLLRLLACVLKPWHQFLPWC